MKRLISALLVSVLTVAMLVPVSASCGGSSSVKTEAKAAEAKASSSSVAATQVDSQGNYICYVSAGTPQGINNAYLANMASNTKIGGVATAAINANESKALYDFAKIALGKNCYMITAFKAPVATANGLVRIDNPNLKAGTNVTVLVRTLTGVVAAPAIISNGAITVAMPEGALSVAIFYNAVAPW